VLNIRLGSIAAGLAFIFSLIIGAISGASFPALLLRPLLFAIVFFIITNLIYHFICRFLPELLEIRSEEPELVMPGSKIDLMEDTPVMPNNMYARPDDSEEGVGDISNLAEPKSSVTESADYAGMDQSGQNEYNAVSKSASESGGLDGLPDLESLAGAFMPVSVGKERTGDTSNGTDSGFEPSKGTKSSFSSSGSSGSSGTFDSLGTLDSFGTSDSSGASGSGTLDSIGTSRKPAGNKSQKMEVDFNPKDLAAGIRTVLNKEEG
jgi:hypothetical protein